MTLTAITTAGILSMLDRAHGAALAARRSGFRRTYRPDLWARVAFRLRRELTARRKP